MQCKRGKVSSSQTRVHSNLARFTGRIVEDVKRSKEESCFHVEGKLKARQIAVAKLFRPHLNIKLCRVEEIIALLLKDTRVSCA